MRKENFNTSRLIASGNSDILFSLEVPNRSKLTITKFGNYLSNSYAWGSVIWRIKKNGIGYDRYFEIVDQIGLIYTPREITPLVFNGCDLLEIEAVNNYTSDIIIGIGIEYIIE